MKFDLYDNAGKYSDEVIDILAQYEIQNNLIISNCLRGKERADSSNWFMAVIKDTKGTIQLVALMTPPHNILVYELNNLPNNDAVELLVKEIKSLGVKIPGVLSEKSLALRFSERYTSIFGQSVTEGKKMRIYRLDKVNEVPYVSGKLRSADQNDLYYLPYWHNAFTMDCGMGASDVLSVADRIKNKINNKNHYIWEDGVPVSQASMGRKTLNGAVVGAVYTPPHYRGRGYATSCVASLSQLLIDSGYKFCSLFTDLANPISNSIYMKIGYTPVCDYDEYKFADALI